MIDIIQTAFPKVVGLKLSGRLHDDDFKQFVPKIEAILGAQESVRLLVECDDFHGWDIHAAWDDLWFSLKHRSDFERIALVGERGWEKWLARFGRPIVAGQVKYFDKSEIDAAWKWLEAEDEDAENKDEIVHHPLETQVEPYPWVSYL